MMYGTGCRRGGPHDRKKEIVMLDAKLTSEDWNAFYESAYDAHSEANIPLEEKRQLLDHWKHLQDAAEKDTVQHAMATGALAALRGASK